MSDEFDKEEIMKKLMELAIKQQNSEPNNDLDEYGDFKSSTPDYPFNQFSKDFSCLGTSCIDVVDMNTLTPLEFYRNYVSKNKPCVITNAVTETGAFKKWTDDYLLDKIGENEVTVAFTPDGRADSVVNDNYFVLPCEEKMKFKDFLPLLTPDAVVNPSHGYIDTKNDITGVPYCQHQNNSLNTEFSELLEDIGELTLASEAFGSQPDATNLWVGNGWSTTQLHQDPYENMYSVIRGEKIFTIIPPGDACYWLNKKNYKQCRWVRSDEVGKDGETSEIVDKTAGDNDAHAFMLEKQEKLKNMTDEEIAEEDFGSSEYRFAVKDERMIRKGPFVTKLLEGDEQMEVPWTNISPLDSHFYYPPGPKRVELQRLRTNANIFQVPVKAGEVFYLPALWYHQVDQKGITIAVNWWYDMEYDIKFMYLDFMRRMAELRDSNFEDELRKNESGSIDSESNDEDGPYTGTLGEGEEIAFTGVVGPRS